jgi:DNA primase
MNDAVQQIKERLNILDVVAPYVELHKAGRHFKGKSPFSNEKTPSFYVSPERGLFYCFSTNRGGDMFTFIETIEGVDFKEALRILATKANVELRPEPPHKRNERERLYSALSDAAAFYHEHLLKNDEAKAYLKARGVADATVARWQIGLAPGPRFGGGWRILKEHLANHGYTNEEMKKTGLIKDGNDSKEPFDVFRDRIVFPLFDSAGRIVAFSGRIIVADENAPKYVNSPETELYKKSELLFGYDKAKHELRGLGFWLIVEGQFDVVLCHQAGYKNAVAVSGTALSLTHVQLLERFSSRVVLALDSDRAGVSAVKRAAELMVRRGFDVKVAALPTGADPADLVKADVAEFKKTIGASAPVVDFLLALTGRTARDERAFKLSVREEVLPYVALFPNRIEREHFVGVIAAALGVAKEAVRFELERMEREVTRTKMTPGAEEIKESESAAPRRWQEDRENELLAYLLAATEQLSPSERGAALLSALGEIFAALPTELANALSVGERARAMFALEEEMSRTPEKYLVDDIVHKLNHLRELRLRRAMNEARERLRAFEATGDTGEMEAVMMELSALEGKRKSPPYSEALFAPPTSGN